MERHLAIVGITTRGVHMLAHTVLVSPPPPGACETTGVLPLRTQVCHVCSSKLSNTVGIQVGSSNIQLATIDEICQRAQHAPPRTTNMGIMPRQAPSIRRAGGFADAACWYGRIAPHCSCTSYRATRGHGFDVEELRESQG